MITTTTAAQNTPVKSGGDYLPCLENGDRLSRAEFERLYEGMPELNKAELVERVIYMGSPVRHDQHGKQHLRLNGWLFN